MERGLVFASFGQRQGIDAATGIYFPEYKIMGQQYDDLGQRLEDFRESDDRSMLLLGTPGMGKTSIIACLAQRHRDDGNMLFLKFRDLGTDLTDGENLLTSVCRIMGCRGSDLSGKC